MIIQGAIIQAGVEIGRHCIINTGTCVDHECRIEDYVHLSPHSTLCRNVTVSEGSWVGAGTIVLDPRLSVKGEERVYEEAVERAFGGAARVTHAAKTLHTACEPNRNVEACRWRWTRRGKEPAVVEADASAAGVCRKSAVCERGEQGVV